MFRWCAYCWTFLGERAPFEDLSATHGICEGCVARDALSDADALTRMRPLAVFHADMVRVATDEAPVDVEAILARGSALGIRPLDLLVGILQPALYEVGRLWEEGRLRPAQEARLTSLCRSVLDTLTERERARAQTFGRPILLLTARGNVHDLGIRILAYALLCANRDARVLPRPPTAEDAARECVRTNAASVGVSLGTPDQRAYVEELVRLRDALCPTTVIVVGGRGASGESAPAGVRVWTAGAPLLTTPAALALFDADDR